MAETPSPESVVREFWRLMATNDFRSVKAVLAQEFVMDWPQSKERIRGAENFARMNAEYPTTGRWQFRINRLVASAGEVVTVVVSVVVAGLAAVVLSAGDAAGAAVSVFCSHATSSAAPARMQMYFFIGCGWPMLG